MGAVGRAGRRVAHNERVSTRRIGRAQECAHIAGFFNALGDQKQVRRLQLIEGWSRQRWRFLEPILPDGEMDKKEDQVRMTQEAMHLFSGFVREHPEQYFWYNKRWVLEPLEVGLE